MISNLEASVLGLICEEDRYGYELDKIIDERNMRNWTEIAFSSIYYVLKRLEKKGLIKSNTEYVDGRSRKLYSITPQGLAEMKEKVKDLVSNHHKVIDPFDLGIGNLNKLPHEEIISSLRSYLSSLETREDFLRKRLEVLDNSNLPPHIKGLITRPLAMLTAERSWVAGYIEEMSEHFRSKETLK